MFYPKRVFQMCLVIVMQGTVILHGAELVRYDFSGFSGSQTSTPYMSVAPNLIAENITRGNGITSTSLSDSMCSTGWSSSYNLDPSQNDYYEFSLTPKPNYKFIIGHFNYAHYVNTPGPYQYAWRTSSDNFTQNLNSNEDIVCQSVDIGLGYSSIPEINSKLTLRDYAYRDFGSPGIYALENHYSKGGLVLTGVVLPTSASASLWYSSGGGSYNLSSNWKNSTVPNGVDDAALLWYYFKEDSTITVDAPVTLGTLDFDRSSKSITLAGLSNITMQTSVDNPRIGVYAGSHTISAPLTFSGTTHVDSGPDVLTISNNINGAGGLTKLGAGMLTLGGANIYAGITAVEEGVLSLTGSIAGGASIAAGANLKGTGTVDGNVVAYSGSTISPGNSIDTLSINGELALSGMLDIQFNSDSDTINKLIVSNELDLTGGTICFSDLGSETLAEGSYVFATYGSLVGNPVTTFGLPAGWIIDYAFEGNSIALTSEISSYIPGDANGDGRVDGDDATILAANWQTQSGATWATGDFNGDGAVNDIDATLMASNWQQGAGDMSRSTIPEPGCMAMLAIGAMGFIVKMTRRRR